MAGAGYKSLSTGDVLTASDLNTYGIEQTVMVFASSTARDTALSSAKSEGMFAFLKDALCRSPSKQRQSLILAMFPKLLSRLLQSSHFQQLGNKWRQSLCRQY